MFIHYKNCLNLERFLVSHALLNVDTASTDFKCMVKGIL